MSDVETIEAPKRKRGRPRKNATPVASAQTWNGIAAKHPAAYAASTLRLIAKVSTEAEVRNLANNAAAEFETAAA